MHKSLLFITALGYSKRSYFMHQNKLYIVFFDVDDTMSTNFDIKEIKIRLFCIHGHNMKIKLKTMLDQYK